jgi:tripartite-type tricarboxylate transporter receptor subunit TctC
MRKQIAVGLCLCLLAGAALAQAYPSRPVKVLIPYGPGSGIDVVVRQLNEALSKSFGQTFVSENKPGAAGTIAAAYVLSQPADGYTILSDSSSHTIVPSLMAGIPFDTARDISGVTTLIENPLVLVTGRGKGINTAAELIAAAKAKPGSITYASAGIGSSTHISAEKFRIGAGFDGLHIPFKSSTDGLVEVMAGRIDFTYTALASALSGIRDGKLVALAMVSRRVSVMPNVPSVEEVVPGASYSTWLGIMVSSKTPRDIVQRLNQEIVKVMASADMKERLLKLGSEPWTMSPEEFDALRRKELIENERLVKAAGIKTQ